MTQSIPLPREPGETYADAIRRTVLNMVLPLKERRALIIAAESIPVLSEIEPPFRWVVRLRKWQVREGGKWVDTTKPSVVLAVAERLCKHLHRASLRERWGISDPRRQYSVLKDAGMYSIVSAAVELLQTPYETEIAVLDIVPEGKGDPCDRHRQEDRGRV